LAVLRKFLYSLQSDGDNYLTVGIRSMKFYMKTYYKHAYKSVLILFKNQRRIWRLFLTNLA